MKMKAIFSTLGILAVSVSYGAPKVECVAERNPNHFTWICFSSFPFLSVLKLQPEMRIKIKKSRIIFLYGWACSLVMHTLGEC